MAAPATVDELLDLVRKSGVVDEKRLDTYLQKMRSRLPADVPGAAEALVRDGVVTRFQSENILAGKWRRFSIGKYKVLERLGAGGMGQVYLCEHKLMRRRVAVKVLPTAKAKDSSALDRFYREARAVAALTHPNIVHAYDIDQDESLHFLVMEYVDGANLQQIVKISGPLDVLRACHYIRQAALALQYAHEAGLVHRDIKPGNILVDRGGVVKILDLGLARFFHDEEDLLTQQYDESVLGTADYMSPEQALDSHTADIRADIYSLGATFYFLLTGRPPFESANVAQKLMMHQFKNPTPIEDCRKDVPAGVLAIIQKMMAKDTAQRYAVPVEVAEDLTPFTEQGITPPDETEMPQLCPAASGNIPVLDGPETTITRNETPAPTRIVPGNSTGAPKTSTSARPTTTGSGRTAPASAVATTAVTKTAPPQTPAPDKGSWEKITGETNAQQTDTHPESGRQSSKLKKNVKKPRSQLTLAAMIGGGIVGIILLLGCGIGVPLWYFNSGRPPAPPPPAGPPKLEVSKSRPGAYTSIQFALRKATIGCIIELWDDVHEENLVVDRNNCPANVNLRAATGKEIVWRSAKKDPEFPLVRIDKAGDFKFRGYGITLDGTLERGNVKDLMQITGDCAGTMVEELRFKKFARAGIRVENAAGSAEHPIRLSRLTIETDEKPGANLFAIAFYAYPKTTPLKNEHIRIEECEYRGFEARKAIHYKPKDIGKGVTLGQ